VIRPGYHATPIQPLNHSLKGASSLDPFIKKGLMLMIDGADPDRLRATLEIEIAAREERHEAGVAVLESLGGFAPTLGIIGTVMGLINVLSNLSDTSTLGHKIAGAFIATFYGVFMANILFLPLGGKLKTRTKHEMHVQEMCMEGILTLQAGDNPRLLREKLDGFLPPKQRGHGDDAATGARAGAREQAAAATRPSSPAAASVTPAACSSRSRTSTASPP